ncbi:MAG TPA: hypothetical protein P5137_17455 [Candidatus Brocadiia bacterium]|nr:hypothetical protein [Candidatus Brocadiia bacterium]
MAKSLNCRVSAKYRGMLGDMAALFVEEGESVAPAARRIREELEATLDEATLARWAARCAEFKAAVAAARVDAANAKRSDPVVRGSRDIAWLQETLAALQKRHKEGGDPDGDRAKFLRQILEIEDEIRAQERHLADLADRAARRDFARFVRNLVEWAKVNHPRQADVIVSFLRAAMKSLGSIVAGKTAEG